MVVRLALRRAERLCCAESPWLLRASRRRRRDGGELNGFEPTEHRVWLIDGGTMQRPTTD